MIALKPFQSKYFQIRPRELQWNDDAVIEWNRTSQQHFFSRYVESTTFISNKLLLLGGLTRASIHLREELPNEITITEIIPNKIPKLLCVLKTGLPITNYTNTFDVLLSKPVSVKAGIKYKIKLDRSFGNSIRRKLVSQVEIDSDIIIEFMCSSGPIVALNFNHIPIQSHVCTNSTNITVE